MMRHTCCVVSMLHSSSCFSVPPTRVVATNGAVLSGLDSVFLQAKASASHDIPCPSADVHNLDDRYAWGTGDSAKFVLEGCGQRVSYALACTKEPTPQPLYGAPLAPVDRCELVLVGRMSISDRLPAPLHRQDHEPERVIPSRKERP